MSYLPLPHRSKYRQMPDLLQPIQWSDPLELPWWRILQAQQAHLHESSRFPRVHKERYTER